MNSERLKENVSVTIRFRPLRCSNCVNKFGIICACLCKSRYVFTFGEVVYKLIDFVWSSPREIRQGEEIAWYANGETIVRNENTPSIAFAYGMIQYSDACGEIYCCNVYNHGVML